MGFTSEHSPNYSRYVCVCVFVCLCVCVCVCVCACVCACVCTCVCVLVVCEYYMSIRVCIFTHTFLPICIHLYAYVLFILNR